DNLCGQLCHLLHYQNPALQGDALKKMWGKCSVYPSELRAPKASYTAERFVWISKLNNLKINNKPLTPEQKALLKELPFEQAKLSFTQVRKKLGLTDNATFNLCRYVYDKEKTAEQNLADSEKATLFEAKFFHEVKKAYKNLPNEWGCLKDNSAKLDQIGEVLAFYKEDNDRKAHLGDFSDREIDAILELNFDKSLNLSLKAIREILPLMENGLRYDEACEKVYGNHYGKNKNKKPQKFLPVIDKQDSDTPNNPVVYRTITQARKIINAIIAQYGQPFRVHIEMGRDLGKSRDERNKIEKQNKDNQAERERERQRFIEMFRTEPTGKDILLFRLYQNQHGKCLYSGKPIDLERIFEKGYVEIDHAIPFSRSWNDSQNNKVLVLGAENQNKGNKTPFEWLGQDEQKWRDFEARVNACRFSLRKKQNILRRELDDKEFIERNINDTRYATRYLKNYLENNLAFSGSLKYTDKQGVEHFAKKVFAPQGQITSLLRNSWGFSKVREDNDRHHALDAIIVACTTESMQQKLTLWHKRKENRLIDGHYHAKEPFPTPWDFFRNEINLRVFNQVEKIDDDTGEVLWEVLDIEHRDELIDLIRQKLPDRPAELAQHEFVQPLFVSRKVHKKISGQGHLETLYSEKSTHKNKPQSGINLRGGIVANASMIRIDVFRHKKTHKNYIVPIYLHQAVSGVLPNRAIVSGKDKDTGQKKEWLEMTEEYEFIYSFYPFDLIEIKDKKNPQKRIFGYYRQCNSNGGTLTIQQPEDDLQKVKNYKAKFGRAKKSSDDEIVENAEKRDKKEDAFYESVGIQNMEITKYAVDVLGRKITPIAPEERQGFDAIFDDELGIQAA
ncbi:MAG: type II CRISPR RNA-guided endonuclease Cas9, partial [Neisseriaceae bacterium]|nr:type II CRISPR RNA-guided endonuclease Cas9 [Neisseriaceae bacterium]